MSPLATPPKRERHDLAVEQAEDRLQRPHPAQLAVAPAHRLRPGEARGSPRQQLGQDARPSARPGSSMMAKQHPALLVLALLQRVVDAGQARAGSPRRACSRRVRRAGPCARPRGRPAAAAGPCDHERQAARRGEGADRPLDRRARPRSAARYAAAPGPRAARACMRAGISSENSSSSSSAMRQPLRRARAARLRRSPSPARARGRYRPRARSR